jgi:urease beta subunit
VTPSTGEAGGAGETGRPADAISPGEVRSPDREVVLAAGLARRQITVTSRSLRPIRVSSHYPFWRSNPRLEFDRGAAVGYRLDIPAGTSVRWRPGETREVDLVALGGSGGKAALGGSGGKAALGGSGGKAT